MNTEEIGKIADQTMDRHRMCTGKLDEFTIPYRYMLLTSTSLDDSKKIGKLLDTDVLIEGGLHVMSDPRFSLREQLVLMSILMHAETQAATPGFIFPRCVEDLRRSTDRLLKIHSANVDDVESKNSELLRSFTMVDGETGVDVVRNMALSVEYILSQARDNTVSFTDAVVEMLSTDPAFRYSICLYVRPVESLSEPLGVYMHLPADDYSDPDGYREQTSALMMFMRKRILSRSVFNHPYMSEVS